MNLLLVGDIHGRGNSPVSRTDDILQVTLKKLEQVLKLAVERKASAVICAGDFFNSPLVSVPTLVSFADLFNKYADVNFITVLGNHDVFNYNLSTYRRTSLYLLEMMTNITVIDEEDKRLSFEDSDGSILVTFQPFTADVDVDGYGYKGVSDTCGYKYRLHVVHGMLMDHEPPFKHTQINDVKTDSNVIFSGHDHVGYGHIIRYDGVHFINNGSLTRLSAHTGELTRKVVITELSVIDDVLTIDTIGIEHQDSSDVFDLTKIEEEKERKAAMASFSDLLKNEGVAEVVNIDQLLEIVSKNLEYGNEISDIARDKINKVKQEKES